MQVFSTGKKQFNCTSILLFDLFTVYSVNEEDDWDFGTDSVKSCYFKNNVCELRSPEIWLFYSAAINTLWECLLSQREYEFAECWRELQKCILKIHKLDCRLHSGESFSLFFQVMVCFVDMRIFVRSFDWRAGWKHSLMVLFKQIRLSKPAIKNLGFWQRHHIPTTELFNALCSHWGLSRLLRSKHWM